MQKQSLWTSFIIGMAIILTAFILSNGFKNRNVSEDTINVVGLGTVNFASDEIFWQGSFAVKFQDAKEAYNKILFDKEKVKTFFSSKGFKEGEFIFGGTKVEKTYRYVSHKNENGNETSENIFDGYQATQTVTFSAKKNTTLMAKIEKVADQTSELINSGIEFNAQAIQYTYSELPGLKHSLIESATEDAKQRADKIINQAKGRRGKLKDASMGVFQITGIGSNEEDSYGGNFDIYSKEKTARVTVRLTYNLK